MMNICNENDSATVVSTHSTLGYDVTLAIQNDEFCIKHDEFCIKHDEFCIKHDE